MPAVPYRLWQEGRHATAALSCASSLAAFSLGLQCSAPQTHDVDGMCHSSPCSDILFPPSCLPPSVCLADSAAGFVAVAIAAVAFVRPWRASPSLSFCALPANLVRTSAASGAWGRARAQARLEKPLVILICSDGFRVDYFLKLHKDSHILRCTRAAPVHRRWRTPSARAPALGPIARCPGAHPKVFLIRLP